jgi:hypothetical protein
MNRKDQIAGKLDAYFHEKSMPPFSEGSAYSDSPAEAPGSRPGRCDRLPVA